MKRIYIAISITENGKQYAFAETIRTGENLLTYTKRHKNAVIFHLCESRIQAEETALRWNATYKANGVYMFDEPPKHEEEKPLRVCAHCLAAIESREGRQAVREIYIDEDEPQTCEWCESETDDILYEFI